MTAQSLALSIRDTFGLEVEVLNPEFVVAQSGDGEYVLHVPLVTRSQQAFHAACRGMCDALKWPDSLSASRAVSAAVLPPALTFTPDSALIEVLSPAKVLETSETGEIQAGNSEGLIMPLLITVANPPQVLNGQALTRDLSAAKVITQAVMPGADGLGATSVAELRKQA